MHLRGPRGAAAVDRLATVLLDRTRHETPRLAALRALRELDPATIAPMLASLADDPNATIRTEAGLEWPGTQRGADDPAALVAQRGETGLPDDPAVLRHALNLSGASVPLPVLLKVVERVREREGSEPAAVRDQWRLTRAAAHVALANRGSRLALYDLRESLETAKGAAAGGIPRGAVAGRRRVVPGGHCRCARDARRRTPGGGDQLAGCFATSSRAKSSRAGTPR